MANVKPLSEMTTAELQAELDCHRHKPVTPPAVYHFGLSPRGIHPPLRVRIGDDVNVLGNLLFAERDNPIVKEFPSAVPEPAYTPINCD